MIESLSKTQRQALALAILALVLIMIFSLAIAPLWAINRHYLDTIDTLDTRLEKLQRSASAGTSLRSQHEQLKRSLASNRHYLKSTSEALAASNLQRIVEQVATSKGMEVLSTQILPASEESGFTRVALKVRMRGRLENTVEVFHALESGQPYLFLDNVSIRNHARTARKMAFVQTPALSVDFDLIGYMLTQS